MRVRRSGRRDVIVLRFVIAILVVAPGKENRSEVVVVKLDA